MSLITKTEYYDFSGNSIIIGRPEEISNEEKKSLIEEVNLLIPWRKGPFTLFGETIDAQWLSYVKWQRLSGHVSFQGKRICDAGANNGYYMFKMHHEKAQSVFGFDIQNKFIKQFHFIRNMLPANSMPGLHLEKASFEILAELESSFDLIVCMGLLYHVPAPFELLSLLHRSLAKGGELILETLIIPGEEDKLILPKAKYAGMTGVWFLPTEEALYTMIRRSGFSKIEFINLSQDLSEQRETPFCPHPGLSHYLREDGTTVEGHLGPHRILLKVRR